MDTQKLKQWHKTIDLAMNADSHQLMAEYLITALRTWLNFDTSVAFVYQQDSSPTLLFDDYPASSRQTAIINYNQGVYLLDPFYCEFIQRNPKGIFALRELAPDDFADSEYFDIYYKQLDIADELSIYIRLKNETSVVISIARNSKHPAFNNEDLALLNSLYPLLATTVTHFHGANTTEPGNYSKSIASAFENFAQDRLTKREQEISKLILQGHSSKSLAREINISPYTVKVHRKNIYERLEINTQAELFKLFLQHLETLAGN